MKKLGCLVAALMALLIAGWLAFGSVMGEATIEEDTVFAIPAGSSLTAVANRLEEQGLISSADGFLLNAKLFGGGDAIQAGEFELTADMSQADILGAFQSGDVIRRFITIPEGMPSIMVFERLMAHELLTGKIEIPPEGSVLPDTYDFERGEARSSVLARMQGAMTDYLDQAWEERSADAAVTSKAEAVILASIIEKETGVAEERRIVSSVFVNRLNRGMRLQTDPTVIYGITLGQEVLGRGLRQSELRRETPWNTYVIDGLPETPIANPGRASLEAAANPADTNYVFFVADGTGGHAFAETLEEHNANVARWREIEAERANQ